MVIGPEQLPSRRAWLDRAALAALALTVFAVAAVVNVHQRLHVWADGHPPYNPFVLLPVAMGVAVLGVAYLVVTRRRLRQEVAVRQERESALTEALHTIEVLSGLLAMCASCKSVRNSEDEWESVELYLQRHAEIAVTHGICPTCASKLYPDYLTSLN